MTLVAGVDSSTQSCKVVVVEAETGALVRAGSAPHPEGSEVHPEAWWQALAEAVAAAGGLESVAALAVAAQQHGLVALDERGEVVRPALLWNDTRSAEAAEELIRELPGGAAAWAAATGSVPVASFTVTKLRWLAEHEPRSASRVAAVCLPHDYLTWRLRGAPGIGALTTDRADASGTGYWSPATGAYRPDLLRLALGSEPLVPTVLAPSESPGRTAGGVAPAGLVLGAGTGDNAAAAFGLGVRSGDVVVSVGTSGVVSTVSPAPPADPTGLVAGFADATGSFLPLVCTLNAARVLTTAARLLGVGQDEFDRLALAAPPGADGLVLVPYLEGERTPDRPTSSGSLHGLTLTNAQPSHVARAAVEGVLCGLADALDALQTFSACGPLDRLLLVGGGARSKALRVIAPQILGAPVAVPEPGEYVALGAARQAAWALSGRADPPAWSYGAGSAEMNAVPAPEVRDRYAQAREHVLDRLAGHSAAS
jgi:xylulokinase